MSAAWWGGLLTLVTGGLSLAFMIGVHIAPTGVGILRDPVSQYQLTRARPWITTCAMLSGVACVTAIVALSGLIGAAGTISYVLLAIGALTRFVIPLFRMDAPGTAPTATGRFHHVLAFVMFGTVAASAFLVAGGLHDAGLAGASLWSTISGIIMVVGTVGLLALVAAKRSALFGFFERVIYVGIFLWFGVVGFAGLAG